MKKVIIFAIPILLVLIYWTEIMDFIQSIIDWFSNLFHSIYLFATTPVFWKINPTMIGVWVVWKFHRYLWSDKVDLNSGEKIGEYSSIANAEYHTKKYVQNNYESGYSTEKWESPDGKGGWIVTDFIISVAHVVCTVIFVPIKKQ